MKRIPFLFAAHLLVLSVLSVPAGAAVRLDRAERAAIRHINSFRAAHGLHKVRPMRALNRAAERHSRDMARSGIFSHTSSNGTPFHLRVKRLVGDRAVGETLAWHTRRRGIGRIVVRMWINSPPHRAILLESRYRRIGVARRHGRWTADFASRR